MPNSLSSGPATPLGDKKQLALTAGLAILATVVALSLIQATYPYFLVPEKFDIGMGASSEARQALEEQQFRVDRLNAAMALAISGATLCGMLSIIASNCCSLAVRLPAALGWGGLWGAITGFVGVIAYSLLMPTDTLPSPTNTGMAQAATFAILGGGIGLFLGGISRNRTKLINATVGGAVAGAAGAIAFPIITSIVMPTANVLQLIPISTAARPIWLGLPFIAISLTVVHLLNKDLSATLQVNKPE